MGDLTDPSIQRDIIAWYSAGHSARATGALVGVSATTVSRVLKRHGVVARTVGEARTRHTLRHDAFDVLTPDAAYWCGFLFADGSIGRRSGQPDVSVALTASDRAHLEKFRSFLGSTHTITSLSARRHGDYMSRPAVRFSVRSQRLADRLCELGRYGVPLDRQLADSRDFWRGVVDGDGTVGVYSGGACCKVVGSERLMRGFADFIGDLAAPRKVSVRPHRSIYQVSTGWSVAERVVLRLYGGTATSLERKAVAAAKILEVAKFTSLRPCCIHGHKFDEANTYWHNGKRHCRKCSARRSREYTSRRAA